jgi:hypothetical protein
MVTIRPYLDEQWNDKVIILQLLPSCCPNLRVDIVVNGLSITVFYNWPHQVADISGC